MHLIFQVRSKETGWGVKEIYRSFHCMLRNFSPDSPLLCASDTYVLQKDDELTILLI